MTKMVTQHNVAAGSRQQLPLAGMHECVSSFTCALTCGVDTFHFHAQEQQKLCGMLKAKPKNLTLHAGAELFHRLPWWQHESGAWLVSPCRFF